MKPKLGQLELYVLLATARLGDNAYAVSIAREISEHTKHKAGRSSVYVSLQRLEQKGLVTTRLGEPLAERGGKARRLVTLTHAGRSALHATQASLRSLWSGLDLSEEAAT